MAEPLTDALSVSEQKAWQQVCYGDCETALSGVNNAQLGCELPPLNTRQETPLPH